MTELIAGTLAPASAAPTHAVQSKQPAASTATENTAAGDGDAVEEEVGCVVYNVYRGIQGYIGGIYGYIWVYRGI